MIVINFTEEGEAAKVVKSAEEAATD